MDVEQFVSDFTAGMDKASELAREVDRRLAVIDAMLTTIEGRQTDENARISEENMERVQAEWEAKQRVEMACQAELLRAKIVEIEAEKQQQRKVIVAKQQQNMTKVSRRQTDNNKQQEATKT